MLFYLQYLVWHLQKSCNRIESWNIYRIYKYIQCTLRKCINSNSINEKKVMSIHFRIKLQFLTWNNLKINEQNVFIEDHERTHIWFLIYTKNSIHDDYSRFMVYWRGRYSYFNDEQYQISDVEMMNCAFGSSWLSGSRVRSNCIGNNTCAGRRINLISKPTPIHGPVHKSELNFSYAIKHFSSLPHSVIKKLSIDCHRNLDMLILLLIQLIIDLVLMK